LQWKEGGYEEWDPSEVHEEWRKVMDHVENGGKMVQICMGTGEKMPIFKRAVMIYVQKVVSHLEEVMGLPIDAYTPAVLPWR
jgi:hypothetical protein